LILYNIENTTHLEEGPIPIENKSKVDTTA
jgi:hypothetical protein